MVRDAAPAGIGRLNGRPSTIGEGPPPDALSNPLREKMIRMPLQCPRAGTVTTMTVAPICAGMSSVYDGKVTALIVARASSASLDTLAERAGVSHKYLVPVDGMPMIERLVMNATMSPRIGTIRIAAGEADEIAAIPSIAKLVDKGRLAFTSEAFDMVDSMFADADGASYPILITTADNCLWLPRDFTEFADKAIASKAAAASAIARKEDVIAVDPVRQERSYEFSEGRYSSCNTYWIADACALSVAQIMCSGGEFAKDTGRMAEASQRDGFELVPIVMEHGYCAIAVNDEHSLHVTEKLLMKRLATA